MDRNEAQLDIESAIFEVALSLDDPAHRREFLARTFRDDPAGLQRIVTLLDSASESVSFFLEARDERGDIAGQLLDEGSLPAAAHAAPEIAEVGSSIGNYQLLRCLGEGGSGIVFEAQQTEPIQRRVALKVIRVDHMTGSARYRFDVERQALAMMDHPNIAKVLDAGGIHNGQPYFVMELLEGEPITTYCDRNKLGIKERIQLFIEVCGAIQHAHAKRIIHRDIKPSNVLITVADSEPVPKVIDFGIAKNVSLSSRRESSFTEHDQFIGTPSYMSPEQVEMIGVDVDTRSDIYSLGVLLYELLTSRTPFDRERLVDDGMASMRRTLLEDNHPRPSTKLAEMNASTTKAIAQARNTDPARLFATIRGDLDWVATKALEKDRNQRYETANGLAMDLRRFLADKPVSARRAGNLYILRKFIKRNKTPFYAAAAVAISILMGFGVSTTLYLREKDAVREQERLSLQAQRARDQELHLRRQAQARANVSRVAFLLSEGQVAEADELLQKNPLVSIEPSREASSVFRVLGNWYATYGRWHDAAQCFRLMSQATEMNRPEEIVRGSDLLITAPALIESGDKKGYEAFRKEALAKYLPVADSLEAEHILKICLLQKVTPATLEKLQGAAQLCEDSLNGKVASSFRAWEAFSLVLYYHRKGEYGKVISIGNRGLAEPNIKEVCNACIRSLMAIAHHRLGHHDASRQDLESAIAIIRRPPVPEEGDQKVVLPRWYDWSVASLLLKEAETALRAE